MCIRDRLLGGRGGVSIEAGTGLEMQSIAAAVLGGTMLLGGRGSIPAAMTGALALELLFTLLNLLGLPKPLDVYKRQTTSSSSSTRRF